MNVLKVVETKTTHPSCLRLLSSWLAGVVLVLNSQGVQAQGEIIVSDITPRECVRFCRGLVNTEGCLHAYYYSARGSKPSQCRLTNHAFPNPNMPGTYKIWSRRHDRWLKAADVTPGPSPGPRGLLDEFISGKVSPCRAPAFDPKRLPRSYFWQFHGPEEVVLTRHADTYCSLNGARYYLILGNRIRQYAPSGGGHFSPQYDCIINNTSDPNVWRGTLGSPGGPPGPDGCWFRFR